MSAVIQILATLLGALLLASSAFAAAPQASSESIMRAAEIRAETNRIRQNRADGRPDDWTRESVSSDKQLSNTRTTDPSRTPQCAEKMAQYEHAKRNRGDLAADMAGRNANSACGFNPYQADKDAKKAALRERRLAEAEEERRRPSVITSCDGGGCWGSDGTRYNSAGGGNFNSTKGGFCRSVGNMMHCN